MSLVSAGDGPDIGITGPEDGEWYSSSEVLVEGWSAGQSYSGFINMTELGRGELESLVHNGKLLVFRIQNTYADEFNGGGLSTDEWTIVNDYGSISVYQGYLHLRGDQNFSAPLDQVDQAPLIRSNGTIFSDNPHVDWTAEFRFRSSWIASLEMGAGITNQSTDATKSLVGVYMWEHEPRWIRAYANGQEVWNNYYDETRWRTYRLVYNSSSERYVFYLDDVKIGNFTSDKMAEYMWFGSNDPLLPRYIYHGEVQVDYARVWSRSGAWTSRVIDMGQTVAFDAFDVAWNSSQKKKASVELWAQTSMDNVTWTNWSTVVDGLPSDELVGRYVRYSLKMGFPSLDFEGENIKVDGIAFDYHIPITSLGYNQNGGGWTSIDTCSTWNATVNLVEDTNLLVFRAIDARGLVAFANLTLIMDTTAPTGSVSINGGASWSNDRNVTLKFLAEDRWGVVMIELSHDPVNLMWHERPFCETLEWRTPNVQGMVSVYARFTDSHGWVSETVTDTIMYDSFPPMARIQIENGAQYSPTALVTVLLEYNDINTIVGVRLSNAEDMTGAQELPVGTTEHLWDISTDEDGIFTVYLEVIDIAGNVMKDSDSIEVCFPQQWGSIVIEGGAELVGKAIVSLTIETPREMRVDSMQVSENEDFEDAEWTTYTESTNLFLSSGDGEKTVYVRFEDYRGIVSLSVNDSVSMDTTPPEVTVTLNGGAEYATSTTVQVEVTFVDLHGPGQLWLGLEEDLDDANPVEYKAISIINIPSVEGLRTVYVKVSDEVGNEVIASATVYYATKTPVITLVLPGGSMSNAEGTVDVTVEWADEYGDIEVKLAFDSDPTLLDDWRDPAGPQAVVIPPGTPDGLYQIKGVARNVPGLESDVVIIDLVLDRTPPELDLVKPADGSKVTQEGRTVKIVLETDDTGDDYQMSYRINDGAWVPIENPNEPLKVEFPSYGQHTMEVRAVDEAGNEVTSTSDFKLEKDEGGIPGFAVAMAILGLVGIGALRRRRR